MSKSYVPKTRIEKILCGVTATAKTGIEKAAAAAMASIKGAVDSSAPLEVTGVLSENGSGKQVMTLNKTAAELFTAAEAGRLIKLSTEMITGEEPNTTTVSATVIAPVTAGKAEAGNITVYSFAVDLGMDGDDEIYFVEDLAGTATVVLTEA